jgi:S-phase kinase-associated protein 1
MSLVKLKSQTDEIVTIEVEVAKMSNLLKTMIQEDTDLEDAIPLPNVKTAVLQRVIDYCNYHKINESEEISKPLRSTNLIDCGVCEWDNTFITGMDQDLLFEVILAANYLDIKPLLDLSCARVASMIKGKTPEEIRKQFNIINDFTPEEEAQILEENKCFEDA